MDVAMLVSFPRAYDAVGIDTEAAYSQPPTTEPAWTLSIIGNRAGFKTSRTLPYTLVVLAPHWTAGLACCINQLPSQSLTYCVVCDSRHLVHYVTV